MAVAFAYRDSTFADYRVVEHDIAGCEIIYCVMRAPFPVANRDFLQVRSLLHGTWCVVTADGFSYRKMTIYITGRLFALSGTL